MYALIVFFLTICHLFMIDYQFFWWLSDAYIAVKGHESELALYTLPLVYMDLYYLQSLFTSVMSSDQIRATFLSYGNVSIYGITINSQDPFVLWVTVCQVVLISLETWPRQTRFYTSILTTNISCQIRHVTKWILYM